MNPNLPVGGSAFDIASTLQGVESSPTLVGFAAAFTTFRSHFRGDQSIDPLRTAELDAFASELFVDHRLARGVSVGLRLPIGLIRVEPLSTTSSGIATNVTGFGDLELHAAYDFNRLWRDRGWGTSLRLQPVLLLPSGTTGRITSPDAPPNLVSIGTGSLGVGADLQLLQPMTRNLAIRVAAGSRAPTTYNQNDLRFGASIHASAGAVYRPRSDLMIALAAAYQHRRTSEDRVEGEILNSGGDWLFADLSAAYTRDRVTLGASIRAPLYRHVNGEQIVPTLGISAFVALAFGEAEHDHDHDHGEHEHDHDRDHGEHRDDHGEHGSAGGADRHDAQSPSSAPRATDQPAPGEATDTGDVADLATGGRSFRRQALAVPGKKVVIDFWADWCKPCKQVETILRERAAEHPGLAVRKVEVPSFDAPVAREHLAGVRGLPTVWLVNERGEIVEKLELVAPDRLRRELDAFLAD